MRRKYNKQIVIFFFLITSTIFLILINQFKIYPQNEIVKYFFSIPYWNDDIYQIEEREALDRGNFYKVKYYTGTKPAILEYYKNLKLQYRYIYDEFRILKIREDYYDGIPDGYWYEYISIKFFPHKRRRILYDKNIPVSTKLFTYYKNGKLKSEKNYLGNVNFIKDTDEVEKDKVKDGYIRLYEKNGDLKYEAFYTNGKLDGTERIFENGKIKEVNHYKNGVRELQSTLFDYSNNTIINSFYQEGLIFRKVLHIKDKLGRTIKIQNFAESSIPYGLWEYYNEDSKLIKTERYKDGYKHGEWQYYEYINNNRKTIRLDKYKNDELLSSTYYYYDEDSGKRLKEETYNNSGLPHNEWYYYDENENLIKKEVYTNGMPNGMWLYWEVLSDGRIETQKYEIYKEGELIYTYVYTYNE